MFSVSVDLLPDMFICFDLNLQMDLYLLFLKQVFVLLSHFEAKIETAITGGVNLL